MKIFLAGVAVIYYSPENIKKIPYVLHSFYEEYGKKNTNKLLGIILGCKEFLLDSGAFTFMNSALRGNDAHQDVDFDSYLERYIEFINDHKIKNFFELDIDSVVGYDKVKSLRKKLEARTGKQCIPVWHVSRGKQEFINLCKDYDYVAVGGLVTREFANRDKYLPWFIDKAHEYGCKIHGLGYTSTKSYHKVRFDTVDSTSWIYGQMTSRIYKFNNGVMETENGLSKGRLMDYKALTRHNLYEWLKCVKYWEDY